MVPIRGRCVPAASRGMDAGSGRAPRRSGWRPNRGAASTGSTSASTTSSSPSGSPANAAGTTRSGFTSATWCRRRSPTRQLARLGEQAHRRAPAAATKEATRTRPEGPLQARGVTRRWSETIQTAPATNWPSPPKPAAAPASASWPLFPGHTRSDATFTQCPSAKTPARHVGRESRSWMDHGIDPHRSTYRVNVQSPLLSPPYLHYCMRYSDRKDAGGRFSHQP